MLNLLAALLLSVSQTTPGADGGLVLAKGKKFLTEVARTPQEQARGLMFRQTFKPDRAMFFLYSESAPRPIWMKNCLISLDVVWIDAEGTIVETAEHCPPCSPMRGEDCPNYGGTATSRHFVEFASGTIKRLGLKKGDRIGWDLAFVDGTTAVGGLKITDKSPAKDAPAKKSGKRKK